MMRKLLMTLTVLAGATLAAASPGQAATRAPALHPAPLAQSVQYYPDSRRREWRHAQWERRAEWERHRRHEEWRRGHDYRRHW